MVECTERPTPRRSRSTRRRDIRSGAASSISTHDRFVDVAPQVANGTVYMSTVGVPPDGHGRVFALSAATGAVRWRLSTIKSQWRVPQEAGGGGAWYPPSVDAGTVYWGTANPYPYGGTQEHPNGGAFAGPALYTDSLVAVDRRSGKLAWYDQVTPHDVRDYDFADLADPRRQTVARVRRRQGGTRDRLGSRDRSATSGRPKVGEHLNRPGPLPLHRRSPSARAARRRRDADGAFAEQVCSSRSSTCACTAAPPGTRTSTGSMSQGAAPATVDALDAATGRVLWTRPFPAPAFGCATVATTSSSSQPSTGGSTRSTAATGRTVWRRARLPASTRARLSPATRCSSERACPSPGSTTELTAYRTQ